MISQVDQNLVLSNLRKLTGVEQICLDQGCYTISNRLTGSEGLKWAKDYIYQELTNLGYSVEIQNWSSFGYSDQNLVARKLGVVSPGTEIYFLAHMDGVNNSPAADDDASGVVSLIELARILSSHSFRYTIVLLFSTGEEQGVLRAQRYVNQPTSQEISAIKYVVNVDMIGYDGNNDNMMELWNGSQPKSFVQLLIGIITTYQIDLTPQIVSDCS